MQCKLMSSGMEVVVDLWGGGFGCIYIRIGLASSAVRRLFTLPLFKQCTRTSVQCFYGVSAYAFARGVVFVYIQC
jgi:hypothetical protein